MQQYLDLLRHIRDNGVSREDRTGTGTLAVFGHQMRFDLADGFPLVTTKKLHLRRIFCLVTWMRRTPIPSRNGWKMSKGSSPSIPVRN